jgi:GNAT superfamily N-acetyltransferase
MDISGIDYLGLDRVLKRGSGKIIAKRNDALLIRDHISGAYMLACKDAQAGMPLLDCYIGHDCDLLMVSDYSLGNAAFERFGFSDKLECYQVAYYGEKPSCMSELNIRTAEEHDLEILIDNYHLVNPDELEKLVRRKNILLGYYQDQLVGFIGEHLEGSMGLLYVFPEFRHRGYGVALQKHLIAKTMGEGYIPFGQVEKGNHASINLQKKIGMTGSDNLIIWMWK